MKPFSLPELKRELEESIEAGKEVHPYPPMYLLGLVWHAEALDKLRQDVCAALHLWPDDTTDEAIVARIETQHRLPHAGPLVDQL